MFCACCRRAEDDTVAEVDTRATVICDDIAGRSAESTLQIPWAPIPEGDFEVLIEARPNVEFGIELDLIDDRGPTITQIFNDGVFKEHNMRTPGREVKPFDRIKSVNGMTGNATELHDMLFSMKDTFTLQMTRPRERNVVIDKTGQPLGVQLDFKDNSLALVVTELPAEGVVAKWNAEHPDDALRVGDRIVKIGGDESLQGFALIEKLKEDSGKFVAACVKKCTRKCMKSGLAVKNFLFVSPCLDRSISPLIVGFRCYRQCMLLEHAVPPLPGECLESQ
eukprot:s2505_g5.t1